jgi:MFS family permease
VRQQRAKRAQRAEARAFAACDSLSGSLVEADDTRPRSRLRQDLRAIVGDGVAFSVMVGIGESYLPAFVLAAGLGEITAGLVATAPMLVGAVFQLVTPAAVARLGSHRRWVVLCAVLQAASFVPLVLAALQGGISRTAVFCVAAWYWGFGMATGPAWNTWVGTLVPTRLRARFFAQRARWCHAALLAALLTGGALLRRDTPDASSLPTFVGLFSLAALARLASAGLLASQSEPLRPAAVAARGVPVGEFLARLRHSSDGRLIAHVVAMQMAVNVAAPFFTPYMLGPLGLSYGGFTVLIAASFVARIAALPLLGRIARRFGARRVLWVGALGVVPLPPLWLVSHDFTYLLGVQLAAGVAWGAFELAVLLSFFEHIDERERTSVLSYFNVAHASATVAGALLGSACFEAFGRSEIAYASVFAISTAARLVTLLLLRRLRDVPVADQAISVRTLAVRPSAGAMQRPIVASIPPPPEGDGR